MFGLLLHYFATKSELPTRNPHHYPPRRLRPKPRRLHLLLQQTFPNEIRESRNDYPSMRRMWDLKECENVNKNMTSQIVKHGLMVLSECEHHHHEGL
mmetsp:Transcript_13056/g.23979  ORF Transcript_13056/g.23979 Transcript_13056/m.23979 type:complete len:97 (+) Transcript_13056:80-370(+)